MRRFKTDFTNVNDFTKFFITPSTGYGVTHGIATDSNTDGVPAHKASINAANDVNNESSGGYVPHRGYPTVQFYKTVDGAMKTPCMIDIELKVNISLTVRSPLIDDWFSPLTFTSETGDVWSRVVTVALSPDGRLYLQHVPLQGQSNLIYQATSTNGGPAFPINKWVKISVLFDSDPISGFAKVYQDGALVSWANVRGMDGNLTQMHAGMYASAAVASGVCYNRKLDVYETAHESKGLPARTHYNSIYMVQEKPNQKARRAQIMPWHRR